MRLFIAAGVALLALLPVASMAKPIAVQGMSVGDVAAWLQNQGYKAQIVTEKDGKSHVDSATGGTRFGVYMFDCKNNKCGSIQFSAGFDTHGAFSAQKLNEWNRDKRWSRVYVDNVNDPWIEYDVDLTPGGTYELLNDEFAIWNSELGEFTKKYGLQ